MKDAARSGFGHLFPSAATVLVLLLLAACTAARQPAPASAPNAGVDSGVLRVGIATNYPPLAFKEGGGIAGMEADLARRVASDQGRALRFVETDWNGLIPGLLNGRFDVIMSGMSITPERAARVRFTEPYMQTGQMTVIRSADLAQYLSPALILNTRARVGVEAGTTGEQLVRTRMRAATPVPFDHPEAAIEALRVGQIDLFIHDAPTVWRIANRPGETELLGLYWPLTEEYLAWAVRPADLDLADRLNTTLEALRRSGRLQAIQDRWMPVRVNVR